MTKPLVLIIAACILAVAAYVFLSPDMSIGTDTPAPELAAVPMPTDRALPAT